METKNLRSRALMKLKNKKLDFIVANQYSPGANNPFGNAGKCDFLLIDRAGFVKKLKGISKGALSKLLLDKIEKFKLNVGV